MARGAAELGTELLREKPLYCGHRKGGKTDLVCTTIVPRRNTVARERRECTVLLTANADSAEFLSRGSSSRYFS